MDNFYRAYRPRIFTPAITLILSKANQFIAEYQKMGYVLTLRQLYYRFIATDSFPQSWCDRVYNIKNGLDPNTKNTLKNYKRLGDIVNHGREAGILSWTAFEDRNRTVYGTIPEDDVEKLFRELPGKFSLDYWEDQPYYVEVFVEKDALGPIIQRPSNRWKVNHMACKGYLSASQAWRAGVRFKDAVQRGKEPLLIHLGDHDPSGQDMTRDNHERLELFSEGNLSIQRIALNMDQVLGMGLPPNPAKVTDSRYKAYVDSYGDDCWELDAIEPQDLDALVGGAIEAVVDKKIWKKVAMKEDEKREELRAMCNGLLENWDRLHKEFMEDESQA